jgi:hypothetical protein
LAYRTNLKRPLPTVALPVLKSSVDAPVATFLLTM